MAIAVVMPVLDEEARIGRAVSRVLSHSFAELVVVDGGSSDRTCEIAADAGARVVRCPKRSRAAQQNFGAHLTGADTLLFLHADVALPVGAAREIESLLAPADVVAGAFRVRHVAERWRGRLRAHALRIADMRSRTAQLPYGDQGLFLRRETFDAVGGFPDIDLMEDLALASLLRARGRIAISSLEVLVSARRFEAQPVRQAVFMNTFPSLYWLGVPPRWLARLYGDHR